MISSFIYRQVLGGNRLTKKIWGIVRRIVINLKEDTPCVMQVHGRELGMPLSHALPMYLNDLPFYDRLPARLSKFIRCKLGTIKCIDVGANVGDTIAAFKESVGVERNASEDTFLAVEPNPRFRRYLGINWKGDKSVIILPYICSSTDGATKASINELNGTANLTLEHVDSKDQDIFEKKTIDSIVQQFIAHGDFNLLKTDTDGHDFEVIAGAKGFIKKSLPFLYFEVDSFSNPNFIKDCLSTLSYLREVGYSKIFVYDNFGSLIGLFQTSDVTIIKQLLFYMLTKKAYYYDFLLMRDSFVADFYESEVEYFVTALKDDRLSQAA
ncbi:FkbM family methyltransferase [Gallionella capsiferriformans]|uniref:Methyltransferase FkbM family n=1 Tax=Gallionella capsiferriformans (strain ES-2) TaxID=395494 RepID=D9SFK8_GALCS|nr:FkbM family methyltransferase [Gallionella capsiferriformans]ADL55305.1 methyltransferase FkbM family [Gallionella capsiferriformans ES-2]